SSGPTGPASPTGPAGPPLGSRVREMTTRIIHWRKDRTPPPEFPDAVPPAAASPALADKQPAGTETRPYAAVPLGTAAWPPAYAEGGLDLGPAPGATRLAGAPANPAAAPQTVNPMVTAPASSGRTARSTVALPSRSCMDCGGSQPIVPSVEEVPGGMPAAGAVTAGRKPLPEKPTIEPPQPSEWHQSWGKDTGPNPPAARSDLPASPTPKAPPVAQTELPHADTSRPDPLKDPASYGAPTVTEKLNSKPTVASTPK